MACPQTCWKVRPRQTWTRLAVLADIREPSSAESKEASESLTLSAVGYNSLITDTWANKHNVWNNDVTDPNYDYWDIFRIAKAFDPTLQTAIFSTWVENRTKLLGDGLEAAGGKKLDYHFDGFEHDTERFPHDVERQYFKAIDELVTNEAAR